MNEIKEQSVKTKSFLKSILNALPGNVVVLNDDLTIFMVNNNWAEIGVNKNLIEQVKCEAVPFLNFSNEHIGVKIEDAENVIEAIQKIKDEETNKIEIKSACYSLRTKKWFKIYVSTIEFENKKWVTLTYLDITVKNKLKNELERSSDNFNKLFNLSQDLFTIVEYDGVVKELTHSWGECLGYELAYIKSKPFVHFVHQDDVAKTIKVFQDLIKNGISISNFENRYLHKDGSVRYLSWDFSSVLEDKKIYAVARDVTEIKNASEKIKETERNYENLLERANDGIVLIQDRCIKFANKALRNLLECTYKELINKEITQFVPENEVLKLTQLYTEGLQKKPLSSFYETQIKKKNGAFVDVEINVSLTKYEGEKAFLAILRNVSERKKQEVIKEKLLISLNNKSSRLQCLNDISKLFIKYKDVKSTKDILNEVVIIVSKQLKFDTIVNCKILFDQDIYKNTSFNEENPWKLKNNIKIDKNKRGYIEVYYEENEQTTYSETLLEEKALLNQISDMLGVVIERKEVQNKLTFSEQKYRALVDNSMVGVFQSTLSGKFIFVNDSLVEMLEFNASEDMIAEGSILRWKDELKREEMLKQIQYHGVVNNFRAEIVTSKGNILWVIFSAKKQGEHITGMVMNITEQTISDKLIKDQKDLLENTLESLSHPFYVINASDYSITMANSAANAKGFIAGSSTCFNSKYNIGHPCSGISHTCPLNEVIKQKKSTKIEHSFVDAEGKERFEEVHGHPIFDEFGNVSQMIEYTLDISDRKIAERALKESEIKFKALVTNNEEIVYMIDKNGKFLLSEGKGLGKIGLKPNQVVGNNVFELYKDYPNLIRDIESALLGVTVTSEREVGKEYFRNWYSPHINDSGEIIGVLGLSVNLTEQKLAENALKEAGARLKLATSAAHIGHWDWDVISDKSYLSPEWKLQLGYLEEELANNMETWQNLLHPEDVERVENAIHNYMIGKTQEYAIEFRLKHKNGSYKWIQSKAEKMIDSEGIPIRLFGCHIDIDDQKKAELTILNHKERLKDLAMELTLTEEKQRKQIATDLHDDVGQLLASSRLQLAAINNSMDMDKILYKTKSISKGMLEAIRAIRSAIFDLSSPQLNEIGLLAATSDWMEEQLEQKYGIKTAIEGDKNLRVYDDNLRVLIFRSIRELLMNVIKHAKTKEVKVVFETFNNNMVISIEDFGVGFNYHPELLRLKNTGFGLFSVQERMVNIGGSMKIESILNKGTKIVLKLPIESLKNDTENTTC